MSSIKGSEVKKICLACEAGAGSSLMVKNGLIKKAKKAGLDVEIVDALSQWGWNCGIIFQISDDILDLTSDEKTLGKPSGNDILEGTYTLPVLIALDINRGKYEDILKSIQREEIVINCVINDFTTSEIISNSKDVINDYFSKSIESIFELKDHALFPVLENLNNYLINRTN